MPAEPQKPDRSWPPSELEPPSHDNTIIMTPSDTVFKFDHKSLRKPGVRNLVLYLIGVDNQQDTLACRNGSRHFITEVNVTLQRGKAIDLKKTERHGNDKKVSVNSYPRLKLDFILV